MVFQKNLAKKRVTTYENRKRVFEILRLFETRKEIMENVERHTCMSGRMD